MAGHAPSDGPVSRITNISWAREEIRRLREVRDAAWQLVETLGEEASPADHWWFGADYDDLRDALGRCTGGREAVNEGAKPAGADA